MSLPSPRRAVQLARRAAVRLRRLGQALISVAFEPGPRGAAPRELGVLIQWRWLAGATRADPYPLFDPTFYLDRYPDVAPSGLDPLVHFLRFGADEGRDPHLLFDSASYLDRHPDVASSGLSPLMHFLRIGAAEGYDPHPLFDSAFYLHRYPDVGSSELNPLVHFLRFGAAEGRDPHPLFDSTFYVHRYPDVASSGLNPLVHFLRLGAAEGRDPHPLFDSAFYQGQSPQLRPGEINPLIDYLRRGGYGGREPHPLFHSGYYLDRNPDVARSGLNPLAHYVSSGAAQGRKPHPLFDGAAYLESCPEARRMGTNPLIHYLEKGAAEGRNPHPLFDTAHYLREHADVRQSGVNPLVHYLRFGAVHGYEASPAKPQRRVAVGAPAPTSTGRYPPHWLSSRVALLGLGLLPESQETWSTQTRSTADGVVVEPRALSVPLDSPQCALAVNQAVTDSSGDYLLLLDTSLAPQRGWIEPLLRAFVFLPRVGAVSPIFASGALQISRHVEPVLSASPGALLMPRDLFLRLGGLDESAPSYADAVARLSKRLQANGFDTYRVPESVVDTEAKTAEGAPFVKDRRSVLAFVRLPTFTRVDEGTGDPAVIVLRLFAALGWHVRLWASTSLEAEGPSARFLRSCGVEISCPPTWPTPQSLLAEGVGVDAVLLGDAGDAARLAEVMAIQPRARILYLGGGSHDAATLHESADYFDAAFGSGAQPSLRPRLDLEAAIRGEDQEEPCTPRGRGDRVFVAGSSLSALLPRLRESGEGVWIPASLPLSEADVQRAAGVVATQIDSAVEVEGIRAAIASGAPSLVGPGVAAATGLTGLPVEGILEAAETGAVERGLQSLLSGDETRDSLRTWGVRCGGRTWPWALAQRSFVDLLRRGGIETGPTLSDCVCTLARHTSRSSSTDRDLVVLSMIPWRYRFQRPQHLAVELGRRRWRVFYVNPDSLVEPGDAHFVIDESPAANVYSLRLRTPQAIDIHVKPPDSRLTEALTESLRELATAIEVRDPVLLVQAPFWFPVARGTQRSALVYDCMDLYRGFPNAAPALVGIEDELLSVADLVVFSSGPLQERMKKRTRRSVVVRNACDFDRFVDAAPRRLSNRPTVGYVGAVDRWFDVRLLELCVGSCSDWEFVLVGSTAGLRPGALGHRPNLRLMGEVDYAEVPSLVAGFDVCIVPFLDSALTRCVDPVKVYEYLAAGKPVVATVLPELERLEPGLVHIHRAGSAFLGGLRLAMGEAGDTALGRRRRSWASTQDWGGRAESLAKALS